MCDEQDFSRLWNGSEPGWVVVHHTEDRTQLRVLFPEGGPTTRDIKCLRAAVPTLAEMTAAAVLTSLKGATKLDLGDFEAGSAKRLRAACEARGLRVDGESYQAVHVSLMNELSNMYLVIEDTETRKAVAKEAIKQGLPVRHSTA